MSTSFKGLHSTTLLRYLPVLSSTATVFFAIKGHMALFPLLQPSVPSEILSPYWKQYFFLSVPGWVGLGAANVIVGYFGWKNNYGAVKALYGWGTVFALGHNLFGPAVSEKFQFLWNMANRKRIPELLEKSSTDLLRRQRANLGLGWGFSPSGHWWWIFLRWFASLGAFYITRKDLASIQQSGNGGFVK